VPCCPVRGASAVDRHRRIPAFVDTLIRGNIWFLRGYPHLHFRFLELFPLLKKPMPEQGCETVAKIWHPGHRIRDSCRNPGVYRIFEAASQEFLSRHLKDFG
jgi:hypothetical protein